MDLFVNVNMKHRDSLTYVRRCMHLLANDRHLVMENVLVKVFHFVFYINYGKIL